MDYLLIALLSIFVYNYILPALVSLLDLVNSIMMKKTTIIQQETVHIQEDIENVYNKINKTSNDPGAIGFYIEDEEEIYEPND